MLVGTSAARGTPDKPVVLLSSDEEDEVEAAAQPAAARRPASSFAIDLTEDDGPPSLSSSSSNKRRKTSEAAGGASAATAAGSGGGGASGASSPWVRPRSNIECPICLVDVESGLAVELFTCGHSLCEDCVRAYVSAKVEGEGQVSAQELICPCVVGCRQPLAQHDVARCLADPAAIERYQRLTLQKCVESNAQDLGCCPTAGCDYMFAWDQGNRKLECEKCSMTCCLVCRTQPWHTGQRCEDFQASRSAQDSDTDDADASGSFSAFASSNQLKACPQCKVWLEKSEGCDKMQCRCGYRFCYACGSPDAQCGCVSTKAPPFCLRLAELLDCLWLQ